jgi:hypothetical protein
MNQTLSMQGMSVLAAKTILLPGLTPEKRQNWSSDALKSALAMN